MNGPRASCGESSIGIEEARLKAAIRVFAERCYGGSVSRNGEPIESVVRSHYYRRQANMLEALRSRGVDEAFDMELLFLASGSMVILPSITPRGTTR